jgi:hypothetical protein
MDKVAERQGKTQGCASLEAFSGRMKSDVGKIIVGKSIHLPKFIG